RENHQWLVLGDGLAPCLGDVRQPGHFAPWALGFLRFDRGQQMLQIVRRELGYRLPAVREPRTGAHNHKYRKHTLSAHMSLALECGTYISGALTRSAGEITRS